MRRDHLTRGLVVGLALASMGPTCGGGSGPGPRTFAAGALVIPMDNCYQARDTSAANQTVACNGSRDDGIFRAYGVVYFLLKHNITVYWTIDGATPKTSVTGADVVVPAPTTGIPVVRKFNWATNTVDTFAPAFPANMSITYIGGPFIVDPADKAAALALFNSDPDFAPFKAAANVDVHEVQVGFTAPQVRPLMGPPPKVAILYSYSGNTSAGVMVGYAKAAGFDWACRGTCTVDANCKAGGKCVAGTCQDCAGGITKKDPTCTQSYVQTQFGIAAVNDGPGTVYDILCDRDFLPDYTATPPDFSKASLLATASPGPYKLLWAPHWESGGSTVPDPNGTIGQKPRNLADWLACINKFVAAGNNLFAECHSIVTLEGGIGTSGTEYGLPITRFQSTNTMSNNTGSAVGTGVTLFSPAEPNMQIADFAFSARSGSVAAYLADPAATTSSSYRAGVSHFITQTAAPNRDVFTTIAKAAQGTGGAAVYFGGHDYNGYTAGTRIVLNTLFNLGFGCADPNTVCNTGKFGICALGHLKCASGGGLECVQDKQPLPADLCLGQDDNCNGIVNDNCTAPTCTSGQTRGCYPGATDCTSSTAAGTFTCTGKVNGCVDNLNGTFTCTAKSTTNGSICVLGTQTCSAGGVWGACTGSTLPGPEVCNGKDDNCNGLVDEGQLCFPGYSCQSGFCMPTTCGAEMSICPIGFRCSAVTGGTCSAVGCPTTPCSVAGEACVGGVCKDPCLGVVCGSGAACSAGSCQGGACYSYGCQTGQVCSAGNCTADPCTTANCPTGTFCRGGDCVRSCYYVQCPQGQVCGHDGFCVASACIPQCVTGEVCDTGTCKADPACAGVGCGNGQVCSGGACVELPCANVKCPAGVCIEGQCKVDAPPAAVQQAQAAKKGCGCSSTGGLDLSPGLALLALLGRRRGRRAPPSSGRFLLAAVVLAVAVGATGCSKKSKSCGDTQTDASNCGACGNACQAGSTCSGASCVYPSGNPFLRSITPNQVGVGGTVAIDFAGDTFQTGAQARFKGAGLDVQSDLAVSSASAARLASLDLSRAVPGTAQVWVLNPGNPGKLISNPVSLTVQSDVVLTTVSPGSVRQDSASTTLALVGDRFVSGLGATLTFRKQWDGTTPPSSTPVSLPATWVDAQHATVTIDARTLAIGLYDLQVRNPGGPLSNAINFTVNAGAPTITSLSAVCSTPVAGFTATATGTFLYPTSSALVTGPVNSVGPTTCASGVGALGQCTGNQLSATVDLTQAPVGTYTIVVVNPGTPAALQSNAVTFCVKTSCSPATCP